MKYSAPTQQEIAEAEQVIGFRLPTALVETYASRGNGGFGPDYGLLGINSGHVTDQGDTALSLYRLLSSPDPESPHWMWPKHLFPILHLGCAIHYCVDLASPGNPIVQFDPTGQGPEGNCDESFTVAFPQLEPWLAGL